MPNAPAQSLRPLRLGKDSEGRLTIEWNDGHQGVYSWQHLRDHCSCAGCRDELAKPADPFRILKPSELVPLKAVAIAPVGLYGYKLTWSDGHDAGIYTLERLRELCQCSSCVKPK